jgi:4-amino-4-deoxy-L-arabinose transferase-like glycosyltransferase/putative flippase GtrA
VIFKFVAFILVGAIGTIVHYSILYGLVEFYAVNPVWGSGWGALAGLLINYVLNYSLTFKSQQPHAQTLPRFALIASLGFCLNLGLMAVFTPKLYYLFAQIITTGIVLVWNFFANHFWTFKMDSLEQTIDTQLDIQPAGDLQNEVKRGWILSTLLVIRLLTLGFYPLYDPSESRYAEMGRKMLETGNWVTPLIDYGRPFWGKPPLTIWLTASSLGLGDINEFFARLPSLLLSVCILWIIYHLVNRQRDRSTSSSTVIILASTVLFFVMSGTVAMDVCMNLGVTLALASFWLALRDESSHIFWSYIFFVGLSIGLLAKGPIAIVLSGISIGLWTLLTNEWIRVWQRIPWVKGTLLMLAISSPWYIIAEHNTPGFLEYFFIGEHWKRFTESGWKGDLYGNGHAQPHGKIWLYWLGGAFPWSLIFIGIIVNALVKKKSVELIKSNDGWRLYCLLWMLAPLMFFTLSANIIWTYTLTGLTGFALLLADWLTIRVVYRRMLALCAPLIFAGLVLYYHYPNVDFFKSQQQLIANYQKTAQADERLLYFNRRPYSAQFYLEGQAIDLETTEDLQASLTESNHDFYAIKKDLVNSLPETIKLRLDLVKNFRQFSLFHAHALYKK